MAYANVRSDWSSGNLIFKERVRGNGASIQFGEDDHGLDVYLYGDTSGAYVLWDETDDALEFVGGAALTIGASGAGGDVTLYGDTAGSYCRWDASDDALEFTEATMAFGTLSSTEQNGVTLSASGNTSVLDVFADNGDTALGDAVYTTLRSRTMIFDAMTAGTVIGSRGQLKTADEADLGPGVYAGVQGYIEAYKDFDVKSGGKVWAVDGCIEAPSSGTVTIASGGIMGAFHAELTGAGTFTQDSGGILAGLYVDEQVTTGDWGYGIYVASGDKAWYSTNSLSGSSAVNNMELAITDATTNSSGYTRGIYVNATVSGTKSTSGEFNGIGVDATVSGTTPYLYNISLYQVASGDPDIEFAAPLSIYVDDLGNDCGGLVGIDIGLATGSNSPAGRHAFMRFRNHSAGAVPDAIFLMEGNAGADYLMSVDVATGYVVAAGVGGSQSHKLKIKINSVDYYIPLNTA